jgi:polyhydroxyalkanoate synthesis repressor PhaR
MCPDESSGRGEVKGAERHRRDRGQAAGASCRLRWQVKCCALVATASRFAATVLVARAAPVELRSIMATDKAPTVIKKYANRRLYHTGTSTYVTLEDLSKMVRAGEDFSVHDARSGEDLTRSVLTQIIFEQESKEGQNLLPVTFLRQLIRFYGDSMQALVPSYLELSIDNLTREQEKLREQMTKAFGPNAFAVMGEQVRSNMALFTEAMKMFSPFRGAAERIGPDRSAADATDSAPAEGSELDHLKQQMAEMQKKLEALSRK